MSAGTLALFSSPAFAAQPDDPGCEGTFVAANKHLYGVFGASGNPNASAGPGYLLKTHTATVIHEDRAEAGP